MVKIQNEGYGLGVSLLHLKSSCLAPPLYFLLFLSKVSIYMKSSDETQLCWPSQSLWSLIAEHVPVSELPKIRAALGNSLVDMYIDLYAEVRAAPSRCTISLFFSGV